MTLGVVLALGGLLAGGMVYVGKLAMDLQRDVEVFKQKTETSLEHIKKDVERLHDSQTSQKK